MFTKFNDIGQFRTIIRNVIDTAQFDGVDEFGNAIRNVGADIPTILFTGTPKLHGTNASIAFSSDGNYWFQSRRNVITPQKDNAGFAFFAESKLEIFKHMNSLLRTQYSELNDKTVVLYGEWCGGNIQKGVAISGLDKMFVMFDVKVVDETDDPNKSNYYLKYDQWKFLFDTDYNNDHIYDIHRFKEYHIEIDFSHPEYAQDQIVKLVDEVEHECPVGKAFGRKLGIDNTVGEGIVWVGWHNDRRYVFKTKGQKHSASKVKTVASIDLEKVNSINSFVEYAVTENRLNQAIEQVFTVESKVPSIQGTGDFIRWVINDIIKEESDTLEGNGLIPKDVNKSVSVVCRKWFINKLDEMVGI